MTEEAEALLRCPLCAGAFSRRENSLVCEKGHCYDLSRFGDVHLALGKRESFYTRALFESRAKVFESGVYDPVIAALGEVIEPLLPRDRKPVLVDAGCGEGFYTRRTLAEREMTRIGFDLSKEAVRLAARGGKDASFFVGDLANIPLRDGCADVLLDVFTPANYAEFGRVVRHGGVLVKLAPREGYLRELREAAGSRLRHTRYDGAQVEDYAKKHIDVIAQRTITYTLPVDRALAAHLARMTPMLSGIDIDSLDLSRVTEITIDETLLAGAIKTGMMPVSSPAK